MSTRHRDPACSSSATVPCLSAVALGSAALSTVAIGQIRLSDYVILADGGYSAVSADMDSDGDADIALISSGAIRIHFNAGDGTFGDEVRLQIEYQANRLAAGHLDGDGHIDLVWQEVLLDRTHVIRAWFNDGDGRSGVMTSTPVPGQASLRMFIRDMNGDALGDVVFQSSNRTLSILFNVGGHAFEYQDAFVYGGNRNFSRSMVPGDFDSDGDVDIAQVFQYQHYYSYEVKHSDLLYLMNDGSGNLLLHDALRLTWQNPNPYGGPMGCGDMDGDGDLDLVLTAHEAPEEQAPIEVMVASNEDGERFENTSSFRSADNDCWAIAVSDLDLDGKLDVSFIAYGIQGVYVLRNIGEFRFEGVGSFYTGQRYGSSVLMPDLTGDGLHDLVVSGSDGLVLLANETPIHGPRYSHSELRRGREATFVVSNAEPGEDVWFVYSREAAGYSLGYSVLGGMTIDLVEHFEIFGVATARPDGRAILRRTIPAGTAPGPVATQAVIRRGVGGAESVKTPFRSARIGD